LVITPLLLWFHIFAAVGWLGAAMVFGMLIGPTIGTLTPGARAEVVLKLFPKYVRYAKAFGLITVIFGLALVLDIGNGDMSVFSPSTSFGLYITTGAVLALVAVVMAFAVISPSANRVCRLTEEMVKNSSPPSPELSKAATRLRVSSLVGLAVLVLVLVFMVAGVAG